MRTGFATWAPCLAVLSLSLACVEDPEPEMIPSACAIGGELPRTAEELVARIEALPHPVTIPCVLASLPRPLSLVATDSIFSVQPAVGAASPRVFVMGEDLILSVALAGEGHELLEIAAWTSTTQTLKGEIPFPVEEPVTVEEVYTLAVDGVTTRCGKCHTNEALVPELGAYESDAIRPASNSLVSVEALAGEHADCDWEREPSRCAMLSGLFDFGPVEQGAFDPELPTFY